MLTGLVVLALAVLSFYFYAVMAAEGDKAYQAKVELDAVLLKQKNDLEQRQIQQYLETGTWDKS